MRVSVLNYERLRIRDLKGERESESKRVKVRVSECKSVKMRESVSKRIKVRENKNKRIKVRVSVREIERERERVGVSGKE